MVKRTRTTRGKSPAQHSKARRTARRKVAPIPTGFHTVTPYLTLSDAAAAIKFYKRAFGAKERGRMSSPDGKIMHADVKIGDSHVFLADEYPGGDTKSPAALGSSSVTLHLYFRNVDQAFARATEAGARATMAPADMFWGDRFAKVTDPFGHCWSLGQHQENVSPKEMTKRAAAAFPPPSAEGKPTAS
jgi:PhnB protein